MLGIPGPFDMASRYDARFYILLLNLLSVNADARPTVHRCLLININIYIYTYIFWYVYDIYVYLYISMLVCIYLWVRILYM